MPIDADIDKMTNVERAEKNDRFSNKTYWHHCYLL